MLRSRQAGSEGRLRTVEFRTVQDCVGRRVYGNAGRDKSESRVGRRSPGSVRTRGTRGWGKIQNATLVRLHRALGSVEIHESHAGVRGAARSAFDEMCTLVRFACRREQARLGRRIFAVALHEAQVDSRRTRRRTACGNSCFQCLQHHAAPVVAPVGSTAVRRVASGAASRPGHGASYREHGSKHAQPHHGFPSRGSCATCSAFHDSSSSVPNHEIELGRTGLSRQAQDAGGSGGAERPQGWRSVAATWASRSVPAESCRCRRGGGRACGVRRGCRGCTRRRGDDRRRRRGPRVRRGPAS